jgi:hypothetical protein
LYDNSQEKFNRGGQKLTKSCLIGFDGFIDHLYQVIRSRSNQKNFTTYPSMESLATKILEQKGESINFELIEKTTKIGGNGPILAQALLQKGYPVTLVGAFGNPIHPIFEPFKKSSCTLYSLTESGVSEILEFDDGKIIFGKLFPLFDITFEKIIEIMGNAFIEALDKADLFVSANWTMLPHMNQIWEKTLTLLPKLKAKKRHLFVDLADPAKRSDEDLGKALELLYKFQPFFEVTLGLNDAEAKRLEKIFGINDQDVVKLREKTGLSRIVQHNKKRAILTEEKGTFEQATDYTPHPKVTTGAGDNFNAGLCHGLCQNFTPQKTLLSAIATSGYYVRHGKSPSQKDLVTWDI